MYISVLHLLYPSLDGVLGYSELLQWVTVQKGVKITGLDSSVKITSDVWTHSPQYYKIINNRDYSRRAQSYNKEYQTRPLSLDF